MFLPTILAALLTVGSPAPHPVTGPALRASVEKGLKWLAGKQNKDGSWSDRGNYLTVTVTSYAGLAMLMEGSTLREGRYAANLRRAVDWFQSAAQPNGLLVPADDQAEQGRALNAHAGALLFLASAHDGDEEPRGKRLAKTLAAAVRYAMESRTRRGAWGSAPSQPGNESEDTFSTAAMLHALAAADRAGVKIPRGVFEQATRYLAAASARDGGVVYAPGGGALDPAAQGQAFPTGAAAAAAVTLPGTPPSQFPKWVAFARRTPPQYGDVGQINAITLMHHANVGRVANALGDGGHRRLDPAVKPGEELRWSAFRADVFTRVVAKQGEDGKWPDDFVGPVFATSLALVVLQLDNNHLPAFSR
jgi:hypothetical protein